MQVKNESKISAKPSKINILIIDDAVAFGGSIVSTSNLIRGLDRDKFEAVFVSSTNKELVSHHLKEASESTPLYILRKTLDYKRLGAIKGPLNSLPSVIQKITTVLILSVQLLVNSKYIFTILSLVRRHKISVIQLNNGFSGIESSIASVISRKPSIMYFRGYGYHGVLQRLFITPFIKVFVSVSEYVRQESIADGIPAARSRVATPPVIPEVVSEQSIVALAKKYNLQEDDLTIGMFGRIVEWKGQRETVRAFKLIHAALPNAKLIFVGDISDGNESYLNEVEKLIEELDLKGHVIFAGYQENVHEYYSLVDVVIHASISPEPSGRVIFEAMSYATPVVGSVYGGPKEFIDSGVDGFIADPLNADDVAAKVVKLLRNPELRKEMGRKAEAKICDLYNKDRYARKMEAIYLESMGIQPGLDQVITPADNV